MGIDCRVGGCLARSGACLNKGEFSADFVHGFRVNGEKSLNDREFFPLLMAT